MNPWIAPQIRPQLAARRESTAPAIETLPLVDARARLRADTAAWNVPLPGASAPVEVRSGERPARIYEPPGSPGGTILYLHGGGFVIGDLVTHHAVMEALAAVSGWCVVGLDYRLAPEHPFPAALDDTAAALADLRRSGRPGPIALAGDSAGANIALGAALAARDAGAGVDGLLLFYGCFDPNCDAPSHELFGSGAFGLSTERMRWFWARYLGGREPADAANRACGFDDLAGLPPAYLAAAGLDPLRDETRLLADRMVRAGVEATASEIPGVVHGFLHQVRTLEAAQRCLVEAAALLADVAERARTLSPGVR